MSTQISDQSTPRDLSMDELWKSWAVGINHRADWYGYGQYFLGPAGLEPSARAANDTSYPAQRTDYQLTNPLILEWQHLRRRRKINLIMTSIGNYVPIESNSFEGPQYHVFAKVWETAHSEESNNISVEKRIEMAIEHKEGANKTFGTGDWQKAWYQYAIAWCKLLPYHIDAFPVGSIKRNSFAEIENALFGNMMACAIKCTKDTKINDYEKNIAYHAAIIAGQLLIEQRFGCTVKQLKKVFDRMNELITKRELLKSPQHDLIGLPEKVYYSHLNNKLKEKRNLDERLYSEDYKLTGLEELINLPTWLVDMYPPNQVEGNWMTSVGK